MVSAAWVDHAIWSERFIRNQMMHRWGNVACSLYVWQLCALYFTYHITLLIEAGEGRREENIWSKSSDSLDPHESFLESDFHHDYENKTYSTEHSWASAKKMAPERDIGVKIKYPCTSLFLTLSQLNTHFPRFFIAKTVWSHFFCTCPVVITYCMYCQYWFYWSCMTFLRGHS